MKLLNLLVCLFGVLQFAFAQEKLVATSCHPDGGRCTGSAYCSACTNCSRCAHCGGGGSCGVCNGSGSGRQYSGTSSKKSKSYSSSSESQYRYVKTETLNLRAGAGTNYEIIEKLTVGQKLIVMDTVGDWIYVKVANTGSIGYVNKSYVK